MSEQNTLIKFGHKFQTKVISSLLGDKVFLQTICDILEPEYFDSDSNKWISQTIRDYFFECLWRVQRALFFAFLQ